MSAERRRRLGMLGGSFDPVHYGHLHAARAAHEAFELDRVVLVPAARPPHKPGRVLAAGLDRLAMLDLVCADEPWLSASGLELGRPGPSFTIDTVRELPRAVGEPEDAEIFLVLGSDNLPGLPTWRSAAELIELVQPVIVWRASEPEGALEAAFVAARAALSPELAAKLRAGFLRLPPVPGSSTDLRERLGRGADVADDVPSSVREYIRARGLYTRAS